MCPDARANVVCRPKMEQLQKRVGELFDVKEGKDVKKDKKKSAVEEAS